MTELVTTDDDFEYLLDGFVIARKTAELMTSEGDVLIDMDIELDMALGRYVAAGVRVSRLGGVGEVTARLLRTITVQERIVEVALSELVEVAPAGSDDSGQGRVPAAEWLATLKADGAARTGVAGPVDVVNAVYTLAKLGNLPPLATVAEHLGVSQSTATRMVALARNARGDG